MGDDRGYRPQSVAPRAGGAGDRGRRWPLPDRGHTPVGSTAGELPVCFAPVEARPADGSLAAPEFGTVRRGYAPGQVDAYIEALAARATAADTERCRADIAEDQLREALVELKQARSNRPTPPLGAEPAERPEPAEPSSGFGHRLERMLREAEREAEQERSAAVEQAAHILARARAEAEAHRRDVERSLSERTAAKDDELRGREAEVAEREREIADRLSAASADASAITEAAKTEAARRTREMLERVAREVATERDRANHEIVRLTEARRQVRAELARLHRDLGRRLVARPDTVDHGAVVDDGGPALTPEQRTASGFDAPCGRDPERPVTPVA